MTLTPRLLGLALYCADQELKRRRGDKPPPRRPIQGWESELVRALELEVSTSDYGSAFASGGEQFEMKAPISARQAAEILRCTTRYIREIADRLDGMKIGARWVFDENTVRDYKEMQRNARLTA